MHELDKALGDAVCRAWNAKLLEQDHVNAWFELTYAQYLTIPRSILEAMPAEWQERFVACLQELDETFDWRPDEGRYWVQLKDGQGRYVSDPLMNYRRPDFAHIESIKRKSDGD